MEELAMPVVQLVLEIPTPMDELEIALPMLLEVPPQYEPGMVTVLGWQGALAVIVVRPPAKVEVRVR
jgi:hypothetical protein